MKVRELFEQLQGADPEAEVLTVNHEFGVCSAVQGVRYVPDHPVMSDAYTARTWNKYPEPGAEVPEKDIERRTPVVIID